MLVGVRGIRYKNSNILAFLGVGDDNLFALTLAALNSCAFFQTLVGPPDFSEGGSVPITTAGYRARGVTGVPSDRITTLNRRAGASSVSYCADSSCRHSSRSSPRTSRLAHLRSWNLPPESIWSPNWSCCSSSTARKSTATDRGHLWRTGSLWDSLTACALSGYPVWTISPRS